VRYSIGIQQHCRLTGGPEARSHSLYFVAKERSFNFIAVTNWLVGLSTTTWQCDGHISFKTATTYLLRWTSMRDNSIQNQRMEGIWSDSRWNSEIEYSHRDIDRNIWVREIACFWIAKCKLYLFQFYSTNPKNGSRGEVLHESIIRWQADVEFGFCILSPRISNWTESAEHQPIRIVGIAFYHSYFEEFDRELNSVPRSSTHSMNSRGAIEANKFIPVSG
jgi:hypothetical protein